MTANIKRKLDPETGGFTLIELLIVMAILGVLAVVVLVAINPVQQLARTRDAGRKSAVTQVGHAVMAYYTARNGTFLTTTNCAGLTNAWMDCLVSSGELSTVPSAIPNTLGSDCGAGGAGFSWGVENGLCYGVNGTGNQAVVYATVESNIEKTKCSSGTPYFIFSTTDGRGGLVCMSSGVPGPGSHTSDWSTVQ